MLKKTKTSIPRETTEIELIHNGLNYRNIFDVINQQIYHNNKYNHNFLQKIHPGIFLLTINKANIDPLYFKKITDQAQYAILPELHDDEPFYKITYKSLKNQCHIFGETEPKAGLINALDCELVFFFQLSRLEDLINLAIKETGFFVREVLTNRTVVITDGKFNYPLIISKIPCLAIWRNETMEQVIEKEMAELKIKAELCPRVFFALKRILDVKWELLEGQMSYTLDGQKIPFDYISLIDDLLFHEPKVEIEDYLCHFGIRDLDSASFPTVSVRSLLHLKARPSCLSRVENGFAIVAALEKAGTQTVMRATKNSEKAMSLWLKRALRHIPRHHYQARVICGDNATFSLVGEQVASIAIFPGLLKGLFDALNIDCPKSVRLVAHNEDVLTIAPDNASWVDINTTNKKATTLFRMVSSDGADPLSLFEQVLLPKVGVGNFKLQIVPEQFFELVDTANNLKYSLPQGHDHYLLGLAFQCVHEWGLGVLEFEKALRLDANDPDILHALGSALMEIGHVEDSIPFLKRAFELMPEDPEVANNWGRSNLECGEIAQAIKAFEKAVRLSPGSADYLKNLGDGYLLAARPHDALNILNQAVRCDPHFAQAHASLAQLHLDNGDLIQAEKHALLAFKENPSDADIANLLWQLRMKKNSKKGHEL